MKVMQYQTLLKESGENYLSCVKELQTDSNLTNPEKIFKFMENAFHMSELAEEYVYVVACNIKSKPIGVFEIAHGTVNECTLSPRETFIRLLLCGVASFSLIHNHPSGDISPSREDERMTRKMLDVANLMRVELVDHIIIGGGTYYSFRKNLHVFSS